MSNESMQRILSRRELLRFAVIAGGIVLEVGCNPAPATSPSSAGKDVPSTPTAVAKPTSMPVSVSTVVPTVAPALLISKAIPSPVAVGEPGVTDLPESWPVFDVEKSSLVTGNKIGHLFKAQQLISPGGEVVMLNDVLVYAPEQTRQVYLNCYFDPKALAIPGEPERKYLLDQHAGTSQKLIAFQPIKDIYQPFKVNRDLFITAVSTDAENDWNDQNHEVIKEAMRKTAEAQALHRAIPTPVDDFHFPLRPDNYTAVALVILQNAVYTGKDKTNGSVFFRRKFIFRPEKAA